MGKKKIKELEDRYYDLLNENGVLEDLFKDLSRRFAEFRNEVDDRDESRRREIRMLNDELKSMKLKVDVIKQRTDTDYTKCSEKNDDSKKPDEITYEECYKILKWCDEHGITKEERNMLKYIYNKYVFGNSPIVLFPIKED